MYFEKTNFKPLMVEDENSKKIYTITNKRRFGENTYMVKPTKHDLDEVAEFAYQMASRNGHREYRSGGSINRDQLAIFENTFLGKLGELAFYRYAIEGGVVSISPIDFNIYPRSQWDVTDFCVDFKGVHYNFAVKSTKHFGNLLLLEKADWVLRDGEDFATYNPNKGKELCGIHKKPCNFYDFIVFCRVKLDFNNLKNCKTLQDVQNKAQTSEPVCEVVGYISKTSLALLLRQDDIYVIPKGASLSGGQKNGNYTIMDADNYYIQAGCLRAMKRINRILV